MNPILLGGCSYLAGIALVSFSTTHAIREIQQMTSSEAASWAQAIGSIFAVIAAIVAAHMQFRHSLKVQRAAQLSDRVRRYEALRGLVEAALEDFSEALDALQSSAPALWFENNSSQELMIEFQKALQQISPLEMPSAVASKSLVRLRDLLGTASWNANMALKDLEDTGGKFSVYVDAMKHNLAVVRIEHKKLVDELREARSTMQSLEGEVETIRN